MVVLAPKGKGFSSISQPTLYYYISSPWHGELSFTLTIPHQADPVFSTMLKAPGRSGIHSIDLAALGVELKPGIDYEWFVSIIFDPWERSSDFLASGMIAYAPQGPPSDGVLFWYDELMALARSMEKEENAKEARARRHDILLQAGLPMAAKASIGSGGQT